MFMQNPRDPSLWRSLAVAFGDGLAFGVGMKLSQNAARKPIASPEPPARIAPASDRLERIESRLARLEEAPQGAAAGAGFDRKVMEAVVNALDARLKEHAGQVERRLTELDAKFTLELQTLYEQGRNAASGAGARADECEAGYRASVAALRQEFKQEIEALARQQTGTDAVAKMVEASVAPRIETAVEARLLPLEGELVEQVRLASERAARTAASAADERIAPLREELAEKDREIAELWRHVEESGRASAGVLAAIGNACLQAAQSLTPPPSTENSRPGPEGIPESQTQAKSEPEPPPAEPPLEAEAKAAPPATAGPASNPELLPPGFTGLESAGRVWRVPIVSCFLAAGGLTLLRFL